MKHTSSKRIGVSALTILLIFSFLFSLVLPAFSAAAEETDDFSAEQIPAGNDNPGEELPTVIGGSKSPDADSPKENSASSVRYRRRNEENGLNVKIYANADGTRTLEYYPTPFKYLTKSGVARDILLCFSKDKQGGFVASAHYLDISLPEKLTEGITVGYPDMGIGIGMIPIVDESSAAECSRDCETVSYIGENIAYEYRLTYDGLKEDIVVPAYFGKTEYRFDLSLEGLTPVPSEDSRNGSYHLVDEEGTVRGSIGDILVTTADEKNKTFGNLTLSAEEDGTWLGIISVDADYLADERTVYPIRIDPNISIRYDENQSYTWDDIEDITVNQNHATDAPYSGTLYVGRAGMDYGAMRSVMRFPGLSLTGIPAANIISANLYVRDLMCYGYNLQVDCYEYDAALPTGSFTQSNMTWSGVYNAMLTYETSGRFHSTNYVCYNNGYAANHIYTFNILPAVKDWAQKQNAGNGFQNNQQAVAFKATNAYEASTNEHYVCFGSYDRAVNKPYLEIQYTDPVPEPDPVLPPLSSGVYAIRNYMTDIPGSDFGFLKDSIQLCNASENDRTQLWYLEAVDESEQIFTLTPLSKMTIEYSGTDNGLFAGQDIGQLEYERIHYYGVADILAQWRIEAGTSAYRIYSVYEDSGDVLVWDTDENVKLRFSDNLPLIYFYDRWLFEQIDLPEATGITFSSAQVSLPLGNQIELKDMLTVTPSDAYDARVTFTRTGTAIGLVPTGKVTGLRVGSGQVTATVGTLSTSITIDIYNSGLEAISIPEGRYYFWANSQDNNNTIAHSLYRTLLCSEDNNNNRVATEDKLYDYYWQSVVLESTGNNEYIMCFVSSDAIPRYVCLGSDCLEFSENEYTACKWKVQAYENNGKIHMYTIRNNEKNYLVFVPSLGGLGRFCVLPNPEQEHNFTVCSVFAARAVEDSADISFLSLEYHPSDDLEKTLGRLETIEKIYSLTSSGTPSDYKPTVNVSSEKPNDEKILDVLDNSKYIFLLGHGVAGAFFYTDPPDSGLRLTYSEILGSHLNFEQAKLVIVGACNSADSPTNGVSICDAIQNQGAQVVVGFTGTLIRDDFLKFQSVFIRNYSAYMSGNSGFSSLQDAAQKAALETVEATWQDGDAADYQRALNTLTDRLNVMVWD